MTPRLKSYKPVGRRKYFSNRYLIYKSPFSPESLSLGSCIFVQSNVLSITHSLPLHIYWELDRAIFLIIQNRPLSFNYILYQQPLLFSFPLEDWRISDFSLSLAIGKRQILVLGPISWISPSKALGGTLLMYAHGQMDFTKFVKDIFTIIG